MDLELEKAFTWLKAHDALGCPEANTVLSMWSEFLHEKDGPQIEPTSAGRFEVDPSVKHMTLATFKACIDSAFEFAGETADHVEVEVWKGEECFQIIGVGQFSVLPTVTIEIE